MRKAIQIIRIVSLALGAVIILLGLINVGISYYSEAQIFRSAQEKSG